MIERTLEVYEFIPEETKLFNNVSGIYALLHNDEVIYVGQSININKRLNNHRNSESNIQNILKQIKRECGKCNRTKQIALYQYISDYKEEIEFIILKKTPNRDRWEEHYIRLFKPKFNYAGVDIPFKQSV